MKFEFDINEALLKARTDSLLTELDAMRIAIAIDRQDGTAHLIFSTTDAEAVAGVATIHQPLSVQLTPAQRKEVEASLRYFERIAKRNPKS